MPLTSYVTHDNIRAYRKGNAMNNKFNQHDKVTDGTFSGVVAEVIKFEDGGHAYAVRFDGGRAVRSEQDLTMVEKYVKPEKSFAEQCAEWLNENK